MLQGCPGTSQQSRCLGGTLSPPAPKQMLMHLAWWGGRAPGFFRHPMHESGAGQVRKPCTCPVPFPTSPQSSRQQARRVRLPCWSPHRCLQGQKRASDPGTLPAPACSPSNQLSQRVSESSDVMRGLPKVHGKCSQKASFEIHASLFTKPSSRTCGGPLRVCGHPGGSCCSLQKFHSHPEGWQCCPESTVSQQTGVRVQGAEATK